MGRDRGAAMGMRARRAAAVALVTVLAACSGARVGASDEQATPPPPGEVSASPSSSTTAPTTSTTAPPPDVEVTLAFGGDVLTHLPVVGSARAAGAASGVPYDFGALLAPLAPVVDAVDLALCHLEVPLVADGQEVTGYPSFHAPRELATGLRETGYDGCSTASNHSLDGGLAGITSTLDTFDLLGLGHAGTARDAAEAATPRIYEVGGARIAHLSAAYGFNGYRLPDDAPWAAELIDPEGIAADARAARDLGAQLVVVSVHWGTEYRSDPDAAQEDLARRLAAVPEIDLVIGHHAHVVQPIEQVDGTWVVYGLGNQLSNQQQDLRRDGLTVVVTATGRPGGPLSVTVIEAVPTWVDLATHRVLPGAHVPLPGDVGDDVRADAALSVLRTMEVVNRRGARIPVYEGP